jgi:23S rRNA (cytosine1962-C5)-methyltransferase
MKQVMVSARAAARVQSGHPWVYRSDIKQLPPTDVGELVAVVTEGPRGRPGPLLGTAMSSTTSVIALRMLGGAPQALDVGFFSERLQAALDARTRAYGGTLPEAFRWIHGEADGLPGVVVDRVGAHLSVQVLCQGSHAAQQPLLEALWSVGSPASVVLRNDAPSRRKEDLPLEKGIWRGDGSTVTYSEGRVKITVDLLEGQKTGTFLDQQRNHLLAGALAQGRGMDLCSGDGGFALQMATRAEHVVAVEMSASACARIRHNAQQSGLSNVETVEANAFDHMRAMAISAPRTLDMVVVDPPAFAKGKAHVEAAVRGYKELNLRAMQMLKPGGVLMSCSCSQPVDAAMFEGMLASAAADCGRRVNVISRSGAGPDHPVRLGFPESEYLKCVVMSVH